MQPYPVTERNGVTVFRFFPLNVYWSFARQGQPRHRRALWHLRDAWNRDAGRKFREILDANPPDLVHTHRSTGCRRRSGGVQGNPAFRSSYSGQRLPDLLCPRAFLLTRNWQICRQPSLGCRTVSRLASAHGGLCRSLRQPLAIPAGPASPGGSARTSRSAVVRNGIPFRRLPGDPARRRRWSDDHGSCCCHYLAKGVHVVFGRSR